MARKPVIKTSVDPEIKMQAKLNAEQLGISESAYAAKAVEAEVKNFDYRKEMNKACENAVKAKEDQFKAEQARGKALQERSVFKAKYAEATKERDAATEEQDRVSQHAMRAIEELHTVKAKLAAYQRQGFWGRMFGRVPMSAKESAEG